MSFSIVAEVNTREQDFSRIVRQANAARIGAVVDSDIGPVSQTPDDPGYEIVTSSDQYLRQFGQPETSMELSVKKVAELSDTGITPTLHVKRALPRDSNGNITALWGGAESDSGSTTTTEFEPLGSGNGVAQPLENYTPPSGVRFAIFQNNPNDRNSHVGIRIVNVRTQDAQGNTFQVPRFDVEVYVRSDEDVTNSRWPSEPEETHTVTQEEATNARGQQLYIEDRINTDSDYIIAVDNPTENSNPPEFGATDDPIALNGGDSDNASLDSADLATAAENAYSDPTKADIRLLMNGGFTNLTNPTFSNKLWEICAERKDCLAVLDVPIGAGIQDAVDFVDPGTSGGLTIPGPRRADSYAAVFNPWANDFEESRQKSVPTPPSPYIVNAATRTFQNQEPWFGFMGPRRGQIPVNELRQIFDKGEQKTLVENRINPIRLDNDYGPTLWAQKTQQTFASATDRINVRMLLIILEISIARFAKNFLGEFNDATTRNQLSTQITEFLEGVQGRRGLEDFEVVIDESNNPPSVRNNNSLVGDIALIPTKVIDREIRLNFQLFESGAEFTETGG